MGTRPDVAGGGRIPWFRYATELGLVTTGSILCRDGGLRAATNDDVYSLDACSIPARNEFRAAICESTRRVGVQPSSHRTHGGIGISPVALLVMLALVGTACGGTGGVVSPATTVGQVATTVPPEGAGADPSIATTLSSTTQTEAPPTSEPLLDGELGLARVVLRQSSDVHEECVELLLYDSSLSDGSRLMRAYSMNLRTAHRPVTGVSAI